MTIGRDIEFNDEGDTFNMQTIKDLIGGDETEYGVTVTTMVMFTNKLSILDKMTQHTREGVTRICAYDLAGINVRVKRLMIFREMHPLRTR